MCLVFVSVRERQFFFIPSTMLAKNKLLEHSTTSMSNLQLLKYGRKKTEWLRLHVRNIVYMQITVQC